MFTVTTLLTRVVLVPYNILCFSLLPRVVLRPAPVSQNLTPPPLPQAKQLAEMFGSLDDPNARSLTSDGDPKPFLIPAVAEIRENRGNIQE